MRPGGDASAFVTPTAKSAPSTRLRPALIWSQSEESSQSRTGETTVPCFAASALRISTGMCFRPAFRQFLPTTVMLGLVPQARLLHARVWVPLLSTRYWQRFRPEPPCQCWLRLRRIDFSHAPAEGAVIQTRRSPVNRELARRGRAGVPGGVGILKIDFARVAPWSRQSAVAPR